MCLDVGTSLLLPSVDGIIYYIFLRSRNILSDSVTVDDGILV